MPAPTAATGVAALELARLFPRETFDSRALGRLDSAGAAERWGIAVSGGADSVALLLLVWAHWPDRRRRLCVLHFNHCLRGRESAADARWVVALARRLGLPCAQENWEARPRGRGAVSETNARSARQEFFARAARRRKLSLLLTAHQADDVAETLLLRLARGSGAEGLSAPRPVQEFADGRTHVRPLLRISKDRLKAGLTAAGVAWREDATNAEGIAQRNRVRLRLLPLWRRLSDRDPLEGAARSRARLEEDEEALQVWLAAIGVDFSGERELDLRQLARAGAPVALYRRALDKWLGARGWRAALSRSAVESLLEAAQQASRLPTRGGVRGKPVHQMSAGAGRLLAVFPGPRIRVLPAAPIRARRRPGGG